MNENLKQKSLLVQISSTDLLAHLHFIRNYKQFVLWLLA